MDVNEVFVLFEHFDNRSYCRAVYSSQEGAERGIYESGSKFVKKLGEESSYLWSNLDRGVSVDFWTITKMEVLP